METIQKLDDVVDRWISTQGLLQTRCTFQMSISACHTSPKVGSQMRQCLLNKLVVVNYTVIISSINKD